MARSYRAQVSSAFEVLSEGLAPFVDKRMSLAYPDEDWIMFAATKLGKRRDVLVSLTDPHFQLEVMNRWWGPAFSKVLDEDVRQIVTDLRTARNYWAHPDEEHPFDIDHALHVHRTAEELLRAIGAPEADDVAELTAELRWDDARETAAGTGRSEVDVLIEQLGELQAHYDDLQSQLTEAREQALSATGRSRAFARQLAELQTQYAAVSGLRDEYLSLKESLAHEQSRREGLLMDTTAVRTQLERAQSTLEGLHQESDQLRRQLSEARTANEKIDPLETEAGRRWVWLITALVVVLGLLLVVAVYIPPV